MEQHNEENQEENVKKIERIKQSVMMLVPEGSRNRSGNNENSFTSNVDKQDHAVVIGKQNE